MLFNSLDYILFLGMAVAGFWLLSAHPRARIVYVFVASCQRRVVAAGARYLFARTDTPPEHTLLQLLREG